MGIKGVYGEIGPGTRTALIKLAVEKKQEEGRNFRIAIDFSIWQHQVQLGRGGTNADLRTLFYRSLRFLRLSIEPIFVFDGPHKPPFKRNKKTSQSGGSAFHMAAIELFKLLGFPYITAPGEAEAECALLQREGLVDAVLSEDVDTLMFGCTMHLRSWGGQDPKGKGAATHVDVYKAHEIKFGTSGLDREGMVLVALMSGGDYMPAGIPNCGIKIACEAARAGFGSDLARIDRKDSSALLSWRNRLQHELQTNDSKFFRTKHKTLQVPENFPDKAVLYYYTNPVVSTPQQVERYRRELEWREPNVKQFWQACQTFFDWRGIEGLRHFIRNLAPVMVSWRLANSNYALRPTDNIDERCSNEERMVKTISGQRTHSSTDGVQELRLAYIPQDVVGLGLDDVVTPDSTNRQTHTAVYSGDDGEEQTSAVSGGTDVPVAPAKRVATLYDPTKIEKDWYPEAYAEIGIPLTFEKWKAELNDPKKFAARKARARRKEKEAMPQGAIERYFSKTKVQSTTIDHSTAAWEKNTISQGKSNVSSELPTPMDESLTNLVTSVPRVAAPKRQTLQGPKPSLSQDYQTTTTLKGHTRVTKPGAGNELSRALSKELIYGDRFLELDNLISQSSSSSNKHARSISPIRVLYVNQHQPTSGNDKVEKQDNDRSHKRVIYQMYEDNSRRSMVPTISERTPLSSNLDSENPYATIEIDETSMARSHASKLRKQRSPLTRTISAPTQHTQYKPRLIYNPWKSIDDFDASFESLKTPKKKDPSIVDLTLS